MTTVDNKQHNAGFSYAHLIISSIKRYFLELDYGSDKAAEMMVRFYYSDKSELEIVNEIARTKKRLDKVLYVSYGDKGALRGTQTRSRDFMALWHFFLLSKCEKYQRDYSALRRNEATKVIETEFNVTQGGVAYPFGDSEKNRYYVSEEGAFTDNDYIDSANLIIGDCESLEGLHKVTLLLSKGSGTCSTRHTLIGDGFYLIDPLHKDRQITFKLLVIDQENMTSHHGELNVYPANYNKLDLLWKIRKAVSSEMKYKYSEDQSGSTYRQDQLQIASAKSVDIDGQ